jgi:hypothetical protein
MLPEGPGTPDGLSPATAISVQRVSEESTFIRARYPNASFLQQVLELHPQGPRDVIVISVEGSVIRVYFDISSFFGRRKDRPTAPCPFCRKPLRTPRATQCRHCKKAWHER